MISFIMTAFQEGGIFMYAILVFGIMTTGLIIERYRALYKNLKEPEATARQMFLNHIASGNMAEGEKFAKSMGENSMIGKVAAVGFSIRAQGGSEEELQARMDEALTAEISKVDKRTGFLAMFGNVATLLGLLGTISGMIHSFAAVANANPADRATMLSKGISEAMNCTAFGLLVAIPALVAYAFLQNRTDQIVGKVTSMTTEIYHDLLFLVESNAPSAKKGYTSSNKSSEMTVN